MFPMGIVVVLDAFQILTVNHAYTCPCLIGFLRARYRRGKWGWYIFGVIFYLLFSRAQSLFSREYGDTYHLVYIIAFRLVGLLFLVGYFFATRCEIRRREGGTPASGESLIIQSKG